MHPHWRLSHARGYLALGLVEEAAAELEALSPAEAQSLEALLLKANVLQEQKQWVLLQSLSAEMAVRHPEEASWWCTWAYATRRVDGLQPAEAILRDAETRHPLEPVIQFNLGCYACQLGELVEAKRRLKRAIQLDASYAQLALTDPDLQALRDTGWTPRSP
jgi:tetratricopeptide (TPR) repeat protein